MRALEITHGKTHGWHPHLHILILAGFELSAEQLDEAALWLAERWQNGVERQLGPEHRPDFEHGTDFSSCNSAQYLSKLGLELTAPGRSKRAKNGNRTPMEIAYDFATEMKLEDAELWRDYSKSMLRARMLTWSHGLRKLFKLGEEATDEELVKNVEAESYIARLIPSEEWDRVSRIPMGRAKLLEEVEAAPGPPLLVEEPRVKKRRGGAHLPPRRPEAIAELERKSRQKIVNIA